MNWVNWLPRNRALRRLIAAGVIGLLSVAAAQILSVVPPASYVVERLDNAFYDSFFRLRTPEDQSNGDVVIIAVDRASLESFDEGFPTKDGGVIRFGWPWPRTVWGMIVEYLNNAGARAVSFDLLFSEESQWAQKQDDDAAFAAALDGSQVPIVMANQAKGGKWKRFAPPTTRPVHFGATDLTVGLANAQDEAYRNYPLSVEGKPSLAVQTLISTGRGYLRPARSGDWPLHYYGPHEFRRKRTFRYIAAANLFKAILDPTLAEKLGIRPELFKNKIVLVGGLAAGTYDVKFTPVSREFPGVEIHATAIQNLLRGEYVHVPDSLFRLPIAALAAMVSALGAILPRRISLKLLASLLSSAFIVLIAAALFTGSTIRWLPPATPLIATVIALITAYAWNYVVEERHRRLMVKAFAKMVSPAVAQQISEDPDLVQLGGQRREMTVMFTDIAGFTDLSESIDVERLTHLLNFYLEQMSGIVLAADGTVDKYIGDAIMSFWNAPVDQPDHAIQACRVALAMRQRERDIQPQLRDMGAPGLLTRIGINSGPMAVGNYGSIERFNYTVLGDSVNLGSRLEGANKIYGTQIMVSQTTADLVKDQFTLRKLDMLRVKGKQQPMGVYELLCEGCNDSSLLRLRELFEAALTLFQKQQWDEAEAKLLELQREFPDDPPARNLLKRIAAYREHPPGDSWDGVYVAKDK